MIKDKFNRSGKEQYRQLDTPKTEEKTTTVNTEGNKSEAPKKKKNIIRVFHAQNASDGGKGRRKPAAGERKGPARPQNGGQRSAGANTRNGESGEQRNGQSGQNRTQGGRPQGNRPEGRRDGNRDGRTFEGRRDGGNRFGGNRSQNGEGRPARQGEGNRGPRQNDGRGGSRFGGGANRGQGGQGGRSEGGRGGDNRFSGANRGGQGGGQRPGQRRSGGSSDAVFTPELTKTSKDSKRERDRENKNKKKEFEKGTQGGRRPNQGGRRPNSRIPKALQKPNPQPKQEEKKPEIKEITIPEKLTIRELADAMKMQPSVIVKKLFMEGVMVTVNQEIDFEKAEEIALGFDIIAEKEEKVDVIAELLKEDEEDEDDMVPRPPVVCVMGHVDHGKTSLLDAIRNTNVTRGEAGGITQHIGAYVVNIKGQKITFLDTPGHEAFTAMRMRGANATDIAVLVVAADDGVMPQTVEAINHAKAAGIEIVVAINKIDKPDANPERVIGELAEHGVISTAWGGDSEFVEISAKFGQNIEELLETILLVAEVEELKADPTVRAIGTVIEARLDKGKGAVATLLVQQGTLNVQDPIVVGNTFGRVRAMTNDLGRRIKTAGPSAPVSITGLNEAPMAGDHFAVYEDEKAARAAGEERAKRALMKQRQQTHRVSLDNLFDTLKAGEMKTVNVIIKADVQGSVEALAASLLKIDVEGVRVNVVHSAVGAINESDITLAEASDAVVIGFNVRPTPQARQQAETDEVEIRLHSIIYKVIEEIEDAMKGMLDPEFEEKIIGEAVIRETFKVSKVGTIGGFMVTNGKITRDSSARVIRDGVVIFDGKLASLKHYKDDVKEVGNAQEGGLTIENYNDIKVDDVIEAYIMEEIKR